jgi:Domain of unknown function (DUF4936)
MRELFIYYRVRSANAVPALTAVRHFQAHLQTLHPQLTPRLLRRPDEVDGAQTWMEIYSTDPMRDPAGITAEVQAAIETLALPLAPLLDGPRRTEVFIACAS